MAIRPLAGGNLPQHLRIHTSAMWSDLLDETRSSELGNNAASGLGCRPDDGRDVLARGQIARTVRIGPDEVNQKSRNAVLIREPLIYSRFPRHTDVPASSTAISR
jgi:hypothetical protein